MLEEAKFGSRFEAVESAGLEILPNCRFLHFVSFPFYMLRRAPVMFRMTLILPIYRLSEARMTGMVGEQDHFAVPYSQPTHF
jgi:hypothetical protein